MRNPGIVGCAAALAVSMAFAGDALAAGPQNPHVLIVERHLIMTDSKLGQNIKQQIVAYEEAVQHDLGPEGETLQNEMQAFQQQSASMPADARAKKDQELQAKQAAYRQKLQARQSLIQGGELTARQRYLAEVGAVVHAVMLERGADVVLEKSTVVDSVDGLDITRDVIRRLDKKITALKVPLVKPPAEGFLPMQR